MAISKEFGSSARNTALAGLLTLSLLSPFNALAQGQGSVALPPQHLASIEQGRVAAPPSTGARGDSHVGDVYTRDQYRAQTMVSIEAAKAASRDGVVYHYGEGVRGMHGYVKVLAAHLRKDGTPLDVKALPGGANGTAALFIDGNHKGTYTEDQILRGTDLSNVMQYAEFMKKVQDQAARLRQQLGLGS